MVRAIHEARGDEGARTIGRQVGFDATGSGILRPLVSAVLGMIGRHPDALFYLAAAAWSVAVRNGGKMKFVSRTGRVARMTWEAVPAVARHRSFLLRCVGSLEGLLQFGGVGASAELVWEEGASAAAVDVTLAPSRARP